MTGCCRKPADHGKRLSQPAGIADPGMLAILACVYGIAHMSIEDKWKFALQGDDHRGDFLRRLLPDILAAQWPLE